MNTKKIWANLPVEDLARTSKFYTQIGFRPNGKPTDELVSFVVGDDDFIIHFFTMERFAGSISSQVADLKPGYEVLYSLAADSKDQVDEWLDEVKAAGATIYVEPRSYGKGYGFGFADPDGHKYNVLYWPG